MGSLQRMSKIWKSWKSSLNKVYPADITRQSLLSKYSSVSESPPGLLLLHSAGKQRCFPASQLNRHTAPQDCHRLVHHRGDNIVGLELQAHPKCLGEEGCPQIRPDTSFPFAASKISKSLACPPPSQNTGPGARTPSRSWGREQA